MAYISKKKLLRKNGTCMKRSAGFREKDIMQNSNFCVSSDKGRFVTFYKKNPDFKKSRFETTKYYTATFDNKKCTWVG